MRPDGNVYRSRRRRGLTRGSAFRRQRPGLFLAIVLCAMAVVIAGALVGAWFAFFR